MLRFAISMLLIVCAIGCGDKNVENATTESVSQDVTAQRKETVATKAEFGPGIVSGIKLPKPYVVRLDKVPPKDIYPLLEGDERLYGKIEFDWGQEAREIQATTIKEAGLAAAFGSGTTYEEGKYRIVEFQTPSGELETRWQEEYDRNFDKKWVPHGPKVRKIHDGLIEISEWQSGEPTGRKLIYSQDGKLQSSEYRIEGILIRKREWDESGKLVKMSRYEWEGVTHDVIEYESSTP